MRKLFGISAFLLIALSLVPFASANLINNGSFESPAIAGSYAFVPAASLPGWSFAGAYQELEIQKNGLYGNWATPFGNQWADLDGNDQNSSIFQSVSVTAGTPYHLEFYFSPRPGSNEGLLSWSVLGSGVSLSGNITAPYGSFLPYPVWNLVSLDFTPTSGGEIQVLFAENGNPDGYGMLLDNVLLNAVPIPAAAWLLGTGLLGLVLARRRS